MREFIALLHMPDQSKLIPIPCAISSIEGLAVVTDICSDKTGTLTVGKMVMKKAWIPARLPDSDSTENTTMKPAKVATDIGQTYEVETGSDPYYPRGVVRAIENDKPLMTESPSEDDDESSRQGNGDSDDETSGPDVVSTNDMEQNLENMVLCASLCNMSTIHHGKEGYWQANGDATEVALQVWAHKMGRGKPHMTKAKRPHHGERTQSHAPLQRNNSTVSTGIHKVPVDGHFELVVEHPFDSTIKRMSTVWQHVNDDGSNSGSGCIAFLKGAVERVLDRCEFIGLGDDKIPLTESEKANIISRMDALAAEGLRVLCLSGKRIQSRAEQLKVMPRDELESGMSFLGLAGIYDPPRPQSRGAVLEAQQAGITTRMLTGDHPATASAIARSVAILDDSHGTGAVMTGQQFDSLTEDEIDALPELPVVIARCAPETKVRMVEALHRRKVFGMTRFAVMTGDGVNDSPALKRADVGVAMGLNGSDVAKSVSDIVLADDNFASITRAIRKGRATFSNLSKFLLYLLSGNIAEVLVMLIGLAFKNENGISQYPLSPVAALWINTIAAGPPALALGLEPTAKDAMDHTPKAYKTIFTKVRLWDPLVRDVNITDPHPCPSIVVVT
jgi:Na+-exporting ATPase